jgi:hypothetical protein
VIVVLHVFELAVKPHSVVMAGLVPAIHDFAPCTKEDVDARHKAGHDDALSEVPCMS